MATMSNKELDAKLRALKEKLQVEESDWIEQGRKLYELEDKFLRDTLLEGNILTGWGEPRTAPVRIRNAGVRKRKRERQEAAAERVGKLVDQSTSALTAEEQLKVDRHRLASYSSIYSPAEALHAIMEDRERTQVGNKNKKKTLS
ncbi:Histone H4 acetyltransferase, NuA4 complex, Eaf6 [Plasmopara halstedii]|uniref:Histone H4 acetyltransferase, NuA4 complex, Eaf6 n=1 Tax=Plasmopara halstedii TaxID=4781 RepID=A0A0P1AEF8_PLAHL|nr:Histone H4 acetyltransferase, NuA4 complex, Eaf6 [Plasmopara halstedii]CEG38760.1 Histone H4 acetyltransferase, NuA4 complex, Eaf6 [Plasmopara halstedii]|eukprot:XP_024575129.1 Histone H4 acetyltransferase, NuA4 complex, Eaf6 [Plasmopara halstedii]